jgi:hypothetical protein
MKLMSILSAETKAALGVRPKRQPKPALPARLARRRGVIPPKLLAFEGVVARNHVDKDVRRWLRAELPEHCLNARAFSTEVLDDAVVRLLIYKEAPADALVLAAAFRIMEYRTAPFAALRASASKALGQSLGGIV